MTGIDLGICAATDISDVEYAVTAERLGYTSFWAGDSQLLWSDCYATLALVADRTSTLRIGPGIAVAGTRPASVTAAALATLNRVAPGRVFAGIGAGNTAMRVAGMKPVSTARLERYVTDVRTLLDGGELRADDGALVRHLMPDSGFVAFEPRIPLAVSGFGPRSMAVAARHADGLVLSIPPYPQEVSRVWERLRGAAVDRAVDPSTFRTTLLTTMVVLEPGQPAFGPDVVRQAGAYAIVSMHYAYEQWRQYGRRPPAFARPLWDEYVAMVQDHPEESRHQFLHSGHNCWLEPDEARFVTPELVEATCLVGTPDQLISRLRELADAGLSEVIVLPGLDVKDEVVRAIAERVLPFVRSA